ncbi:MAG: hypothetical protein VX278_00960 [Myxococcota bacterium]|nr:hypothetical protein [Myxococcota bacterium]
MISPLFLLTLAQAEELIGADRPSVAASSSTVGQQVLQLETGVQIDGTSSEDLFFSVPTMIRYGLSDRFEVRLYANGLGYLNDRFSLSEENSGAQAKWTIFQPEDSSVSLGLLASVDYTDQLGSSISALLDMSFGPVAYWLNVGVSSGFSSVETLSAPYSMGVGYLFPNRHGLFLETAGQIPNTDSMSAQVGYFWLSEQMQIDLYMQRGFSEPPHSLFALGLAYKFN